MCESVWRVVATAVRGVTRSPHDIVVHPGTRFVGVRFRAGCSAAVLGVPAASLRDRSCQLSEIVGDSATLLSESIESALTVGETAVHDVFDAWIGEQTLRVLEQRGRQVGIRGGKPRELVDEAVARAVDHLVSTNGCASVQEAAEVAGISLRTLQRRFMQEVGMSAKQFAQVRRARAMLCRTVDESLDERLGWSGVAAESGFAD